MRYTEFNKNTPQVGDILALELGDTLIESVISEVKADGVVIALDKVAIGLIKEAKKKQLSEAVVPLRAVPPPTVPPPITPSPEVPKTDTIGKEPGEAERVVDLSPYDRTRIENAFNWCMKHLKGLSSEQVDNLFNLDNNDLLDYLRTQAAQSGAYKKFDFKSKDVKGSQQLIPGFYKDSATNSWEEVLSKFKKSAFKVNEAEYQGRKVQLGKPMKGDVKKSKVYVKGPKGNVVKVNFGDPNMKIKKSNPKRRKSFRARHNCDNPGPRWKARYWSCRAW